MVHHQPLGERFAELARWRWSEIAFWLCAAATIVVFPNRYLILTEMAWLGLFAVSLDLILGYAGIISLGHAAFFGIGAYTAGLLAVHGAIPQPVLALVVAGLAAAVLGFLTSFLVMRGSDLTRLMVTLGIALVLRELANKFSDITGGFDGLQGFTIAPVLGLFEFDIFGRTGFVYCTVVLFVLFLAARRLVNSPFGLSLRAIHNNRLRAEAVGIPVDRRLVAIYTVSAFYAGVAGALFTHTTALASLDVFAFERSADLLLMLVIGGGGYLYGGIIGAVAFKILQEIFSTITPQYWLFWIGLVFVVIVLLGRERMRRWALAVPNLLLRRLGLSRGGGPDGGAPR
jgi:branched-chain amino acid transport system permease protein